MKREISKQWFFIKKTIMTKPQPYRFEALNKTLTLSGIGYVNCLECTGSSKVLSADDLHYEQ